MEKLNAFGKRNNMEKDKKSYRARILNLANASEFDDVKEGIKIPPKVLLDEDLIDSYLTVSKENKSKFNKLVKVLNIDSSLVDDCVTYEAVSTFVYSEFDPTPKGVEKSVIVCYDDLYISRAVILYEANKGVLCSPVGKYKSIAQDVHDVCIENKLLYGSIESPRQLKTVLVDSSPEAKSAVVEIANSHGVELTVSDVKEIQVYKNNDYELSYKVLGNDGSILCFILGFDDIISVYKLKFKTQDLYNFKCTSRRCN